MLHTVAAFIIGALAGAVVMWFVIRKNPGVTHPKV